MMSPYFRNLLKSIGHDYMAPDARVYNTKQYLDGGRVGFENGGDTNYYRKDKAVNSSGKNLKNPDYLEELNERIWKKKPDGTLVYEDMAFKDLMKNKVITDKEMRALQKIGYTAPRYGKKRNRPVNKSNEERYLKSKKNSSPTLLAEMAGKEGLDLSHLSLTELDSLQNLGYLPRGINLKSYHGFEKKIIANAKDIYAAQADKNLSLSQRRKKIAEFQKKDRALRKQFPRYADIKARLQVQATNLDSSGIKIKEKLPNAKRAISQEPGTTLKGVTPSSAKGKDLIEIANKDLAQKLFKKVSLGKKVFSAVLGPGALAFEAAAIVPFAVADYKAGLPKKEMLANASFNILGESRNRRRDKLAVKLGYDTKELKRSRDYDAAVNKFRGDNIMEDTQMSPDDLYQFPQQYNKSEEDLYKAIASYEGNKEAYNKDVKGNESLIEILKLQDKALEEERAQLAQKSMEGPIDSFFATGGIAGLLKK
jgi:hypothetical protein